VYLGLVWQVLYPSRRLQYTIEPLGTELMEAQDKMRMTNKLFAIRHTAILGKVDRQDFKFFIQFPYGFSPNNLCP